MDLHIHDLLLGKLHGRGGRGDHIAAVASADELDAELELEAARLEIAGLILRRLGPDPLPVADHWNDARCRLARAKGPESARHSHSPRQRRAKKSASFHRRLPSDRASIPPLIRSTALAATQAI
jgi:hypothetical protein